jgi:hypothetical protein
MFLAFDVSPINCPDKFCRDSDICWRVKRAFVPAFCAADTVGGTGMARRPGELE